MSDFTRPDERMAKAVDEAIEMEVFSGCVLAWKHLHTHAVPHGVAMRVLSQDGPRRAKDSHEPALRLASRVSAQDLLAEPVLVQVVQCGSVRHFPRSGTARDQAGVIDHAIRMVACKRSVAPQTSALKQRPD